MSYPYCTTQLLTPPPQWPWFGAPSKFPTAPWNTRRHYPDHYPDHRSHHTMCKKNDSRVGVPAPAPIPSPAPGVSQAQQPSHPHVSPYDTLLSTLPPLPHAAASPSVSTLPRRPRQDHRSASRYTPLQPRSQYGALGALSIDQLFPSIETPWSPPHTPYAYQPHQSRQYRQHHTRQARPTNPRLAESAVSPPPAPSPSKPYLEHANEQPARLTQPRKLLVLLDLNGTLLFRPRLDKSSHRPREHILRPGARELISYLFDNHAVMVYTSATRRNAVPCVDALLKHLAPAQRNQLIGIRPREQLGLTHAQLNAKVQVYKPLEPVWKLKAVQASAKKHGCRAWDASNTVLLDDSPEKARANPHNLLQVPEFKLADGSGSGGGGVRQAFTTTITSTNLPADVIKTEAAIMQRVQARLEQLKWEVSAARRIRVWQEQKMTMVDNPSGQDISTYAAAAAVVAAYPTPETTPISDDDDDDDNNNDNDDNDNDNDDDNDDDDNNSDDDDDDDDEDGGVSLVFSDPGSSSPVPLDRFRTLDLGQA